MMLALAIIFFILLPLSAQAVCPICTVAVCAGVGLSQWLGIDDLYTGIWLGGLIVSLIIWTIAWLNKKSLRFFGRKPLIIALYYLATVWPLSYYQIIGLPYNQLWGIDKLLLGVISGSTAFFLGHLIHLYLKKRNNGKSFFASQKVILPVGFLLILNLIFYLICKL